MLRKILKRGGLGLAVLGVVWSVSLTRDGTLQTPEGQGTVTTIAGTFEAFDLPDYAADALNGDYKSYLIEVADGIKIHVLEIGEGTPVYMQHGLPTSGLLYRKVAEALPLDEFRVIMPTMVGLGFSSKIPASQHTIENHLNWMNMALDKMDLSELIFVGHDWGGAVGAGALARSPDLMAGMVVLNTVLDAPKEARQGPAILKVVQTPIIGEILLEGITSTFSQLPSNQNDPASMSPDVVDLYQRPVEESGNAKGPLAILRMSVLSPENPDAALLQATEDYLLANQVPTEIVWGMNDPILGERLSDMQALLPWASVVETEAGHFLQEEAPAEIAASIQKVHLLIQSQN